MGSEAGLEGEKNFAREPHSTPPLSVRNASAISSSEGRGGGGIGSGSVPASGGGGGGGGISPGGS
jgi:hypothetical protein